jgi:regulator of cell morphogenesis and NO signaling
MDHHSPKPTLPITPDDTLAGLATTLPGASRVFHRHGLDFCCHGNVSLTAVCERRGLDAGQLLDELQRESPHEAEFCDWSEPALPLLIEHILRRYHEPHRTELPRLLAMAQKVERVHADKPGCPHGLADLLAQVQGEMEEHMQKEEQILFPAVRDGSGRLLAPAIRAMEQEHEDHGRSLERLRQLTDNHTPPPAACNTWRALYLGLGEFERELMQHIHLENHVLFPRALS